MRPIPPLVLLATLLGSRALARLSHASPPPDALQGAALALALAVPGTTVAGIVAFRRHRTTIDPRRPDRASTLVTGGVFGVTRNPMYVGMVCVAGGNALATGGWAAWLPPLAFVAWLDRVQIAAEERALHANFGAAFAAYAARTGRWLGRGRASRR